MAVSTTGNNSVLSPLGIYYRDTMIPALVANLVYGNLIDKNGLPDGKGQTVNFLSPGIQPQNATVLAEGIPVTPGPTSETTVQVQAKEYGNVFAASSLLFKTSVVDAFQYLSEQTKQAAGYSYDYLVRQEIFNPNKITFGVNEFGAGGATSINGISSSNIMTLNDIRFAKYFLKQNNVKPKFKSMHVGVVDVAQAYDLNNSSTSGGLLDLAKQSPLGIEDIKKAIGEDYDGDMEVVGSYGGMALFSTSLNPVTTNSGGTNIHYGAFWGKDSISGSKLDGTGDEFEIFTKTASKDGAYDVINMVPLAQGYKMTVGFLNLSQDYVNLSNQRAVIIASASTMF